MKLVAQLRVKNGILFIERWLKRMNDLVDEIVVVDNGSTDGTLEILMQHNKVVKIVQTKDFHEGRDRLLLYQCALAQKPDWLIHLDVDEIFEDSLTREIINSFMNNKSVNKFYFRHFDMHKDEEHFEARWDKLLAQSCPSRLMWRNQENGYILNRKIHVSSIEGIKGKSKTTRYRLKHLGTLDREYLKNKVANYIEIDPKRKNTYLAVQNQSLPVWRWPDYSTDKKLAMIHFYFFSFIQPFAIIIKHIRKNYLGLNKEK